MLIYLDSLGTTLGPRLGRYLKQAAPSLWSNPALLLSSPSSHHNAPHPSRITRPTPHPFQLGGRHFHPPEHVACFHVVYRRHGVPSGQGHALRSGTLCRVLGSRVGSGGPSAVLVPVLGRRLGLDSSCHSPILLRTPDVQTGSGITSSWLSRFSFFPPFFRFEAAFSSFASQLSHYAWRGTLDLWHISGMKRRQHQHSARQPVTQDRTIMNQRRKPMIMRRPRYVGCGVQRTSTPFPYQKNGQHPAAADN